MFTFNALKKKKLSTQISSSLSGASIGKTVERVTWKAMLMWSLATSFVMLQFILQLSTGLLVKPLMEAFGLSPGLAGALVGSYYLFYVLMQTPVGYLLDRYGLRRLLSIGAFVCALGCLLFVESHTLWVALTGRVLMGFGASVAFVGCLKVIVHWFPERRIALMTALLESVGITCVLIFNEISSHWIATIGWRSAVASVAIPLLLLSLCFLIWLREYPEGVERAPVVIRGMKQLWAVCRKYLFPNPLLWLNGLCAGLLFSVVTVFGALWGVPFLMVSHHLSLLIVTSDINVILMGILVGCPVMGWLVSGGRVSSGRLMSFSALLTGLLLLVFIYVVSMNPWLFRILCFTLGFVASSYVVSFMVSAQAVPKAVQSVSFGFLNTLMVLVVPILQPLLGHLLTTLSRQHDGFSKSALLHYSLQDYQWTLTLLPVLLLIFGAICWRYLKLPERT